MHFLGNQILLFLEGFLIENIWGGHDTNVRVKRAAGAPKSGQKRQKYSKNAVITQNLELRAPLLSEPESAKGVGVNSWNSNVTDFRDPI